MAASTACVPARRLAAQLPGGTGGRLSAMDDAPAPEPGTALDWQDLTELARVLAWPNADPYGWTSRSLLRASLPRFVDVASGI